MSLLQRLRNLWKLSELQDFYPVPEDFNKVQGMVIRQEPKKAQIIKMKTPVQEFLNNKDE